MGRYLIRRCVQAPLLLLVLATLSFFLMRAAPGGPFSADRHLDPVVEQALLRHFHLDEPLWRQYLRFLGDTLRGDLGPSFKHRAFSVNEILASRLPHSLLLGGLALVMALGLGFAAGLLAGARAGGFLDRGIMVAAILSLSVPAFVAGPLLQILCSVRHRWFPLAGYEGWRNPEYLVLPALTLAIPFAARIARLLRTGLAEAMGRDFVRTARAKGLSEPTVLLRHALREALLPVLSYLGPATAALATGSLVVEKIFALPGLGREFVEAALARDYTLVMGTVLLYGALIIACNLAVDLAYGFLDPRVRVDR